MLRRVACRLITNAKPAAACALHKRKLIWGRCYCKLVGEPEFYQRNFYPSHTAANMTSNMTSIHFAFNTADRLRAACDISARRLRQGQSLAVYCRNMTRLDSFDQLLWDYERTAFVPHVRSGDPLATQTPIVLYDSPPPTECAWVLNLDDECVPEAARYANIIEVISNEDRDRAAGRARWRLYQGAGHTIVQHDLANHDLP